jgi:TonB-linked SusC/RagA family outer membrane protein
MKFNFFDLNKRRKIPKSFLIVSLVLMCLTLNTYNTTAQQITNVISGLVTDNTGKSLPGVSILLKGTAKGTITDTNGEFQLTVPNEAILQFSYVGFVSQEIKVGSENVVNVTLEPSENSLNEVVVIGYGTVKKKDLTGAVSVINTNNLKAESSADLATAISGLASGVKVTSGGPAGSSGTITIRGLGNLTDNEPLYVVDGIPTSVGMDLNLQDIASIQILKDASAAAIYGSRAANGVIIITTKNGEGPLKIDFSTQLRDDWLPHYSLLNADEYKKFDDEAYENAGLTPQNHFDANTDWQAVTLKTGITQNYNLALSGGSKVLNAYTSLNREANSGTLYGTGYDRYAFRVNTKGTKGLFSYGENMYIINSTTHGMYGNPFSDFISMPPTIPVRDSTHVGGYGYGDASRDYTYAYNPIAEQDLNVTTANEFTMRGNIFGQLDLFKVLTVKLNFGYVNYNVIDNTLRKTGIWTMGQAVDHAYISQTNYNGTQLLMENTYEFKKNYGKHNFDALFGLTFQQNKDANLSATALDPLVIGNTYYNSISSATGTETCGGTSQESALMSYLGRVNYNFADKYLITGTIRRDGTSCLPTENRWENFPSIAGAWRISNEKFFHPSFINNLMIRANYGILGSANIGDYDYQASMNNTPRAILGTTQQVYDGTTQSQLVNQNLQWEKKIEANFGMDVAFLNNKLTSTIEYYIATSKNLLVYLPLLMTTGSTGGNPATNAGSMQNKGLEIDLGWKDKPNNDFSYSASINFSTLRNKVLSLGNNQTDYYTNLQKSEVGKPLAMFYLYKDLGIFQSIADVDNYKNKNGVIIQPNAQPGDIKFDDYDGDGQITTNDRQICGNPWPKFEMGTTITAQWKNLDFRLQGFGRFLFDIYNGSKATASDFAENQNNFTNLNPWSPQNTNTNQPRIVYGSTVNSIADQNRWLEDGTFFRISDIALGYTFPQKLLAKLYIREARLGVDFINPITFTHYSGLDPDFNDPGIFSLGDDNCSYPNSKSISFSLSVGF